MERSRAEAAHVCADQPRTHDALQKLGEKGPFVLVGHSYGGPVVQELRRRLSRTIRPASCLSTPPRRPARRRRRKEHDSARRQRAAARYPRAARKSARLPTSRSFLRPASFLRRNLSTRFIRACQHADQSLHLWAQNLPEVEDAENSQREWSDQSFARWLADPKAASLGSLPLIVLTRAEGGYSEDLDVTAAQMEQERKDGQGRLARLSTDSEQIFVHSGHNMELEAPGRCNRRDPQHGRSGSAGPPGRKEVVLSAAAPIRPRSAATARRRRLEPNVTTVLKSAR